MVVTATIVERVKEMIVRLLQRIDMRMVYKSGKVNVRKEKIVQEKLKRNFWEYEWYKRIR